MLSKAQNFPNTKNYLIKSNLSGEFRNLEIGKSPQKSDVRS